MEKYLEKGTIELRDGIPDLLEQRSDYRGNRRNRKTRYRECRFDNRKRGKGWLPPSVLSKYDYIINWIDVVIKYLPEFELVVEIAKFDIQKIKNIDIEGVEYQQGNLYQYENAKQYLIFREKGKCQLCKNKKCDDSYSWNLHHILPRKNSGSNSVNNLALLHKRCHEKLHQNKLDEELKENEKAMLNKTNKGFNYTTFMNIIKNKLYRELKDKYNDKVSFSYGHITKINRNKMELKKTHYNDAIAILNEENNFKPIYIKQVRKKKRSLHDAIPRKGRKKPNVNQKRSCKNTKQVIHNNKNWYLWDKVYIEDIKNMVYIRFYR